MHDLNYRDLPEDIKDILVEGDVTFNNFIRLQEKILLAFQYHGLIPDHGVEIIRVSNGDGYERLIEVKQKLEHKSIYKC